MSVQTEDVEGYDEACHATVHTTGRQEDYLLIPQSILARNAAYQPTHYCGANDNLVVYGKQLATCSILDLLLTLVYLQPSSASPPYFLHFSSDEMTLDSTQETGFSLTYRLRTSIL